MKTAELPTTESDTIELIKRGDPIFLRELYQKYRKEFGSWSVKHYQVDDETVGEIYQKAFIALYYNIKEERLIELKSTIKTYLFAIGKNLLREQFRMGSKFVDTMEVSIEPDEIDNSIMDKYEQSNLKDAVKALLDKIGEPCKTVLELYYFHQYSMDSIAVELNYKTEQIAAKRKFICLKQLKTLVEQSKGQYDI